jgi:CheY-like chemotaxis protein
MNQPKVLIVDDDDNNRGALCDALGGEPYTNIRSDHYEW